MTLKIETILCRAGSMDNYSYLLTDEKSNISAVIDPSEVAPIENRCKELGTIPQFLLNTHHHFDHTDANLPLKQKYGAKIVAPAAEINKISGVDIAVSDGDTFKIGESEAKIIGVAGHTLGHILYYFPQDRTLFTGDTLFNLCIGGIFEGTAEQMWESLQKIKALPDDVLFYPGHEYTVHGLQTAMYFAKNKDAMQKYAANAIEKINRGQPVSPVLLKDEKLCNPYLAAESYEEFLNLVS